MALAAAAAAASVAATATAAAAVTAAAIAAAVANVSGWGAAVSAPSMGPCGVQGPLLEHKQARQLRMLHQIHLRRVPMLAFFDFLFCLRAQSKRPWKKVLRWDLNRSDGMSILPPAPVHRGGVR